MVDTMLLRSRVVPALDRRPVLQVTLGMLLFSLGPVLVAGTSTSGTSIAFWRLWIGAALLGGLTLWRRSARGIRTSRQGWRWTVLAGLTFGINQLTFMVAIKATSVVDVTLMQVLVPVFVGLLAVVMFGERPGMAFRLWSLVAVGGAVVVILAGASGPDGDPVGMALAFVNVVLFAFYFVWAKRAMTYTGALPFLFGVAVVAALEVSVFALVTGEPVAAIPARDLLAAATVAVIPGALGHFLSTHPLPKLEANIPPIIQLAMPFVSGALAWVFLGQGITWLHVLGGGVTIVGVVGALMASARRHAQEAEETTPADVSAVTRAREEQQPAAG